MSQGIKNDAVITIDGNKSLNLDTYLNLLSQEAISGKMIVNSRRVKYKVIYAGFK